MVTIERSPLIPNPSAEFSFIFLPPGLVPPFSSNLLLAVLVFFEVVGIALKRRRLDHLGHLGGLLSGIVSARILKDRARRRKEAEEGRRKGLVVVDRVREGGL